MARFNYKGLLAPFLSRRNSDEEQPVITSQIPISRPRRVTLPAEPISTTTPDPYAVTPISRPLAIGLSDPSASRGRIIQPVSSGQKAREDVEWVTGGPNRGRYGTVLEKPGRLRSAIGQALINLGQGASEALKSGNAGWEGFGQALGGAAGGAVAGAADPGITLRQRHQQAVAESESDLQREMQRERQQAELEAQKAQTENLRNAPERARQQAEYNQELVRLKSERDKARADGDLIRAELADARIRELAALREEGLAKRFEAGEAGRTARSKAGIASRERIEASKTARTTADKSGTAQTKKEGLLQEAAEYDEAAKEYQRQLDVLYGQGELELDKYGEPTKRYKNQAERTRLEKLRDQAIQQGKKARLGAQKVYVPAQSQQPTSSGKDSLGIFN